MSGHFPLINTPEAQKGEQFAKIRAHLRRRGELITDFDILLAAVALHHDLVVLTFNVRHLGRIPDLQLYTLR